MKKSNMRDSGFTLIELMIVFVIIIIMAGMVLRLMGLAGSKNAEAVTREKLERVAQALEEFRATYGRYPPVDYYPGGSQPMEYEFPARGGSSAMPSDIAGILLQKSRQKKDGKTVNIWSADGEGRVFTFGLLSYFFPRYQSHASNSPPALIGMNTGKYKKNDAINQWSAYNEYTEEKELADIVQNVKSARRILPYLGASLKADGSVEKYGIVEPISVGRKVDPKSTENQYINTQLIIRDGWRRAINYRSRPPYDSYKLWSNGPDGKTDVDNFKEDPDGKKGLDYTQDDIVVGEG